MYNMLKHAHSGLRWIALVLLIAAVVTAFLKWKNNNGYAEGNRKLFMFSMIFLHIQLLIGGALYFISPYVQFTADTMKNSVTRFYTVEHITMMILAAVLVTIGHSKSKKHSDATAKYKSVFVFYTIGLLLILAAIPWPFRGLGGAWF